MKEIRCRKCGSSDKVETWRLTHNGNLCRVCNLQERRDYWKLRKAQGRALRGGKQNPTVYKRWFKQYSQRPDVKARQAAHMRRYAQDPRLRARFEARWATRRMIQQGKLIRQPCAECGAPQVHAHHPDYGNPLLIVWLCPACHRSLHKKTHAEGKEE